MRRLSPGFPFSQARSQVTFASPTRNNDMAIQFIQGDLAKMRAHISNIEQLSNRAVPMVPQNLTNELKTLTLKATKLTNLYNGFNYAAYKSKLQRIEDALNALGGKIIEHVENDPNFKPSKAYTNSFVEDVMNRILVSTKQKISNCQFCLDRRLRALSLQKETQYEPTFVTEPPRIETPSPIVVYKSVPPAESANVAVLRAIKDQTERIRRIYNGISDLKAKRSIRGSTVDFQSLSELADQDRLALLDLKMKAELIKTTMELRRRKEEIDAKPPDTARDITNITPEQLKSYEEMTNGLIDKANEELRGVKSEIQNEISMLRARVDMMEQRLDQFADFSGDSDEVMWYIGSKVDGIVAERAKPSATIEINRHSEILDKYLKAQELIVSGSHENMIDDLRRRMKRASATQPLIDI